MATNSLNRFLLVLAAVAASCAGAGEVPSIVALDNHTYTVTVKASSKFTRNTGKLKDEALMAAKQFCAKEGKQLKVQSVTEDKSLYLVGPFAQVTLSFKALTPNDPELTAPAAAEAGVAGTAAPLTNEALYADLLRLDDLRKKGILTDAEFDAEKKKALARSK